MSDKKQIRIEDVRGTNRIAPEDYHGLDLAGLQEGDYRHEGGITRVQQLAIPNPEGTRVKAQDHNKYHRFGGQTDYHPDQMEPPLFEALPGDKDPQSKLSVPVMHYPANWINGTRLVNLQATLPTPGVNAGQPYEFLTPFLPDRYGFGRRSIIVFNNSGNLIYVAGDFNMCTTAMGFPVNPTSTFTLDKSASTGLWVLAPTANSDVRVMCEYGYLGHGIMPEEGYA